MGYKVIEIPEGTYCEICEEADATTYHDNMGFMPPNFHCQDCQDRLEASYEDPTAADLYDSTPVMDEHGRIY
jgi:hypothetical protein